MVLILEGKFMDKNEGWGDLAVFWTLESDVEILELLLGNLVEFEKYAELFALFGLLFYPIIIFLITEYSLLINSPVCYFPIAISLAFFISSNAFSIFPNFL